MHQQKNYMKYLIFCLAVGLPVCLEDIGVDTITDEELMQVAEKILYSRRIRTFYAIPYHCR